MRSMKGCQSCLTAKKRGKTGLSKTFDRQIRTFVIKIYMQGDRKWNWENRSENSESISGNRGRSDCSGSIFILSLDSGCKAILENIYPDLQYMSAKAEKFRRNRL